MFLFCLVLLASYSEASVWVNYTVVYDSVAVDEIVVLQNAIKEQKMIYDMPVNSTNIQIKSEDLPPPPLNLSASAEKTSLNVTWTPVKFLKQNETVRGYTVFYREYKNDNSFWSRIAIEGNVTSVTVTRLETFTTYILRVLAYTGAANGIASEDVVIKTKEGKPSEMVSNLSCLVDSSTKVNLVWKRIEEWNGFGLSYNAEYIPFLADDEVNNTKFHYTVEKGTIENLKPNTRYKLFFTAETMAGAGPKAWCEFKTMQGVPSVAPKITHWELDSIHVGQALIDWSPISRQYENGDLTGYVVYYGISKDGKKVHDPPEMMEVEVDQYTTRHVLKNLENDIEVTVRVAAKTIMGVGPLSAPAYVVTCKCPRKLYTAWYHHDQLVHREGSGMGGILPNYLDLMLEKLCSSCPGLKRGDTNPKPVLYWDRTKDGHTPYRKDQNSLKNQIADNVHLHLPLNGRTDIETVQSKYRFVSIITSPGIAFIVRDPVYELNKTEAIVSAIFECWPAVVIIFLFSTISGMLMWNLDRKSNKDEFPSESFVRGVYHGTYWAFVSMTTIGYGDKIPRSIPARLAAIIWMLMGPVVNGIVIGVLTTSLTTIKLSTTPIIYGTRVGAINNSHEYALGVRRNANMTGIGIKFTTKEELLSALENRLIDGILLDSLEAVSTKITDRKLKIAKIIPDEFGYGIVLASSLIKLEEDIRSYVKSTEKDVEKLVRNLTGDIKVTTSNNELDTGIVDPNSELFKNITRYGSIAIGVAIIIAIIVECGILRLQREQIIPFDYKQSLETEVAEMVREFCGDLTSNIEKKTAAQSKELKQFFWKKGYSLGVDAWLRNKTSDEEELKKHIRYEEIMCLDLAKVNLVQNSFLSDRKGYHLF